MAIKSEYAMFEQVQSSVSLSELRERLGSLGLHKTQTTYSQTVWEGSVHGERIRYKAYPSGNGMAVQSYKANHYRHQWVKFLPTFSVDA